MATVTAFLARICADNLGLMRGYVFIILAAVLWGTTGTSQALAPSNAIPLAIGTMRLIIGGGGLLVFAVGRGLLRPQKTWIRSTTLIAGLSTAFYQVTFFSGVALTGVAVGTVVAIGSAPIFSGLLSKQFHQEHLSRRWALATFLAISGCSVLLISGNETTMQVNPLGVLLTLLSGLSYGVFATANKTLIQEHEPDAAMAVSFSIGALILLPLLLTTDITWVFSTGGLVVALHLGLLATGLAYVLFGRGLQLVTVSSAGTLSLVEPLTATLLGVLVVGERLTPLAIIGMLLIFFGLLVLVSKR